ncbi:MAG: tetratricopeptide repeat protein [Ignavibacteria bacterium]|nr:tetratricopeptide repeat protein [Ignavibacteria bacterium]
MYLEAMRIRKEILGENHPDYANSLNNLAGISCKIGSYENAEPLFIETLRITKEILGENHPYYATSLNNLAGLYFATGNYEKAEQMFHEALRITREILGENHHDYAASLNNLAVFYSATGNYEKSELMFLEALRILKEILGEDHPDYAASLNNLASVHDANGNYEKAEPLLIESNNIILDQFGKSSTFMSEKEREALIDELAYNFDRFDSFSLCCSVNKSLMFEATLKYNINIKEAILSSISHTRNRILQSGDSAQISKFYSLSGLKKKISMANEMSIDERNKKGFNLQSLEEEANILEKDLARSSKDYEELLFYKNISGKDIQSKLEENEALTEFIDFRYYEKRWTDTTYYCALVLRKDSKHPELVKLCTLDELSKLLSICIDEKNSYINSIETSKKLYELIWQPLEKHLSGINKVYISPSGLLNKVSFYALSPDGKNYLIDKYRITYVGNPKDIVTFKKRGTEQQS